MVQFLLANPHSHHCFFTYKALRKYGDVILLCPPLQIQLIIRYWKNPWFLPVSANPRILFFQLYGIFYYILFRLKFVGEGGYVSVVNFCCKQIIQSQRALIWFHYQDYLSIPEELRKRIKVDICELIIAFKEDSANRVSSLSAVAKSDIVVVPSDSVLECVKDVSLDVFKAPYGGDKTSYINSFYLPRIKTQLKKRASNSRKSDLINGKFVIAARANTFRKGADVLIGALRQIQNIQFPLGYESLEVKICGAVQDLKLLTDIHMINADIKNIGIPLKITACQYSQSALRSLFLEADLFVMPSRLEGSSYAALEALWCGLPAVLTKECGVETFSSGRHGVLLLENSSVALAEVIRSILLNPTALIQWRQALIQDHSIFTWQTYVDSFKFLVNSISD